jgi:hypothetical protein
MGMNDDNNRGIDIIFQVIAPQMGKLVKLDLKQRGSLIIRFLEM